MPRIARGAVIKRAAEIDDFHDGKLRTVAKKFALGADRHEYHPHSVSTIRAAQLHFKITLGVVPAYCAIAHGERIPIHRGLAFGMVANGFCPNRYLWLWVPAFAGTTRKYGAFTD